MNTKKGLALLLTLALGATTLFGCAGAAGSSESTVETQEQVVLNLCYSSYTNGDTVDPAIDYNGFRLTLLGVTETLTKINEDTLEVEPHLASSFEQVDETTWVFTIREDVTFSNGKALTAEAVKAALEYELTGITRMAASLDIASIEAEGQTLTITTNAQVATLPRLLSDPSMLIFDTEGTEDYASCIIGTGAYIMESMDSDGNMTLVKNEDYWQGTPGADVVNVKIINDTTAITLALQSGDIDFSIVDLGDVELFEDSSDYQIYQYESGRLYFLYVNPNYGATQDEALLEALQYAMDREAYAEAIYSGRATATTTAFPLWSGYSSEEVTQVEYDPEMAMQILAEAGYADTDGDGFLERDGEKVVLTITTFSSNNFLLLSQAIQASLKAIGLDSEIVVSDSIVADLSTGEFNLATFGFSALSMGDTYNYMNSVFRTGGIYNYSGFSSEVVDALLDEMLNTADTETRKSITIQIQEEVYASNQFIYLVLPGIYKVVQSDVENVTNPLNDGTIGFGDYFNLWKVTKG